MAHLCYTWNMRVLVACEFSGVVRDAFTKMGQDATSCDFLPSETPGKHYQGDVRDILNDGWDLMIAHPPCTHLAVSGARWFDEKKQEQEKALDFVKLLMEANIPRICIENPVSIISSVIRQPDQIIQPWMFGHGETKATCLWLKGLPRLRPTNIAYGRENRVHHEPPGPERWKNRSRTYEGIAQAMATQWTRRSEWPTLDVPTQTRWNLASVLARRKPTARNMVSEGRTPPKLGGRGH